eukprot:maker-scaffold666_size115941-snap-gene-0.10 protein:Tk06217 transcript:maker-scaffold666_size115941-snap-gene-0.10-mRNA-1 annotation:"AGAP001242-PA"
MVLTIGEIAYTQDKRFTPIHEHGSEVWMLKITSPEVDDTGEYECQLSYHEDEEERYSLAFSLRVLNSRAYIQDDRDLHVEKGSQLRLSCSILAASTSPDYVLWYHDGKVLNYSPSVDILTDTSQATSTSSDLAAQQPMAVTQADMKRQRLKDSEMAAGDKNKANDELDLHHNNGGVVSRLSIDNVRRSLHSGNYTCEPSNARAASITVHIVDEGHLAKAQLAYDKVDAALHQQADADSPDAVQDYEARFNDEMERRDDIVQKIITTITNIGQAAHPVPAAYAPPAPRITKPNEALKPQSLTRDNTPVEFRFWIEKFPAYYTTSRMELATIPEQQAYFRS